jgi:hypothetical protein
MVGFSLTVTICCFCFLIKGLGKTITVLALILQTYSLDKPTQNDSSVTDDDDKKNNNNCSSSVQNDDAVIFEVYWRESIVAEFQRPLLFKLLNSLQKQNRFLCFQSIHKSISNDKFAEDFLAFEEDVL